MNRGSSRQHWRHFQDVFSFHPTDFVIYECALRLATARKKSSHKTPPVCLNIRHKKNCPIASQFWFPLLKPDLWAFYQMDRVDKTKQDTKGLDCQVGFVKLVKTDIYRENYVPLYLCQGCITAKWVPAQRKTFFFPFFIYHWIKSTHEKCMINAFNRSLNQQGPAATPAKW